MEPQYAFSIPSMEDDIPLDCRIYHPKNLFAAADNASARIKGAIIAHPYAPLGGSYDDHVVLAVTETLLQQGFFVGTFNFRGAGDSMGRTTWTGKAELQDYISVVGFLIYYLHHLMQGTPESPEARMQHISLTLAGYSYGSLVLARFPSTSDIVNRFETATVGTAAAEITLRARTLANQTQKAIEEQQSPASPRGRSLKPEQSPTSPSKRASPMTIGGEETNPSDRRRSRDSRRSVDVIRKSVEVPHRIKAHIKHRQASREHTDVVESPKKQKQASSSSSEKGVPQVKTSYLLLSPVLLPFSSSLLPPGAPSSGFTLGKGDNASSRQHLQHSALVIFGSSDSFTSSKRLRQWAGKQAQESQANLQWSEISAAGHFWNETGVLHILQQRVAEWIHGVQAEPLGG